MSDAAVAAAAAAEAKEAPAALDLDALAEDDEFEEFEEDSTSTAPRDAAPPARSAAPHPLTRARTRPATAAWDKSGETRESEETLWEDNWDDDVDDDGFADQLRKELASAA